METGKTQSVTYQGKILSLNDYAGGKHWGAKEKWKNPTKDFLLKAMLIEGFTPVENFSVRVRFNSRHDIDNIIPLEKVFVDVLKGRYVPEDDKRFYRSLTIEYDPALPKSTFVLSLVEVL
jgi:hypothetical protein